MIASLAAICCFAQLKPQTVANQSLTPALPIRLVALNQEASLQASFFAPPNWARPHTWWHWMDGNITKEGITADLESMKEAGIGGAQMFHVSQGIPAGPVGYNSP